MASNKKTGITSFGFPQLPNPADMAPVGVLMDAQRENAEAVSEAMQCTMRGLQRAFLRQVEMVARMVQDNTQAVAALSKDGPERRIQAHADLIGHVYKVSAEGMRDVRTIVSETEREISEIVEARLEDNWSVMQKTIAGTQRAKAPEAAEQQAR